MRAVLFILSLSLLNTSFAQGSQTPEALLTEVLPLMPPMTREKIKNYVTIELKNLGDFPENFDCKNAQAETPSEMSAQTHTDAKFVSGYSINYFNKKTVVLNSEILKKKRICKFGSVKKYLHSVLIHELAHIIDKYGWANIENCSMSYYQKKHCPSGSMDKISGSFRFAQFTPSSESVLLRSPDQYEKSHAREHFAVNFEYYILDPNFKCYRPFLFNFYKSKFSFDPYPETTCDDNVRGYFFKTGQAFDLKLANIKRVSYLLASSGKDLDAAWGHSMLEVLFCADDETVSECEKKPSNFLIISFRALVPASQMSTWDGFVGKYYSTSFFYKFSEIKKEYDEQEQRNLIRHPLKLSTEQTQLLIYRIFEKYWIGFENYYILKNNCASETLKVLQAALPESHALQGQPVLTPMQLTAALKRSSLIDNSPGAIVNLSTSSQTLRQTESKISHYLQSPLTYESYSKLSDKQRKNLLQSANLPEKEFKNLARLLYLLEWRLFYEKSARLLAEAQEQLTGDPEWHKLFQAKAQSVQNPLGVWNLADKIEGYGIPTSASLTSFSNTLSKVIDQRQRDAVVIYAKITLEYPPVKEKLDSMRQNLEFFKKSAL